ncbi:UNVERIFIED_CONTAM: hypothetical protein Slati_2379200 [Sesamum latifolium]|uniref:Uncharacterized protein n=1 Tax=Sesamum latifolium TaxID=2727402 RepID=A0AAW2WF70_9LAMI
MPRRGRSMGDEPGRSMGDRYMDDEPGRYIDDEPGRYMDDEPESHSTSLDREMVASPSRRVVTRSRRYQKSTRRHCRR